MTASSEAALKHLRRLKPLDGWSVESKGSSSHMRLLRRSVPLTDNYFLDIHHDTESNQVVGILTNNRNGKAQAQVLVDRSGKPLGKTVDLLTVSTWKPGGSFSSPSATSRSSAQSSNTTATPVLTPEQNQEIIKYAGYVLAAAVALRIVFSTMYIVYILAFPLAFIYLVSTCPAEESFDARRELKRVMRGHHLPEDHPDKPKGFLSEALARITASVTTELATSLGYEVTMIGLAGAALVVCVRVPTVKMDYYWLGAANNWYYVYSCQVQDTKMD